MNIILNNYSSCVKKPPKGYGNITFDFSKTKSVPDSVRGVLFYDNKWLFAHKKFYDKKTNSKGIKIKRLDLIFFTTGCFSKHKRIAIILESPDIEEFCNNDLCKPKLPAQGKTGDNIDKLLKDRRFVKRLDKAQKYLILPVNPVQYQASGASILFSKGLSKNRSLTNKVFRILFSKNKGNFRCDFKRRLYNYHPDFILNCCTYSLKNVVVTAIEEVVKEYGCGGRRVLTVNNYAKDSHPSRWY